MPISFANPLLLFGALGASLPVIIHFLSRRRVRRRMFSDLRFLSEVQARQARSLGIRRWILLLLRVLAILCLVLAVAGPRWGGVSGGAQDRSVLFVIDTSASMNTQMERGTRLDAAVDACRAMITSLPGQTTVQVIAAGGEIRPLFADWLPAGSVPGDALEGIQPTDGPFELGDVLQQATGPVARAPAAAVDLVLLSDLQKIRAIPALGEAVKRLQAARPTKVLVSRIGAEAPGGAVLAVEMPQRALRPGETIALDVVALPDHPDQTFVLEFDGSPVAETVAAGPAQGIRRLTFSLTVPGPGVHRGLVRKESDRLPQDDALPFILNVPPALEVFLAHGADRPADGAPGRGGWRFLEQALAPQGSRSQFRVRPLPSGELASGDLAGAGLLVLVDPDPLGRRNLEGVIAWVRSGGSLLLVAGDPTLQGYLAETLLPALGLPGEGTVFRNENPGNARRMRLVGAGHPVVQGFPAEALGALQDAVWSRWFRIREGDARPLLTLVGGDPILLEGDLGEGRFAVLASNFRPESGTFATGAMALPTMQRLAAWLAGAGLLQESGNVVAGREASIALAAPGAVSGLGETPIQAIHPGDDDVRPARVDWRGGRPVLSGGTAARTGFVTFVGDRDTLASVAVATPAAESGRSLLEPREWRELMRLHGLPATGDLTGTAPGDFATALVGRNLAPWLLLLTVLLLLVELHVGRGVSPLASSV